MCNENFIKKFSKLFSKETLQPINFVQLLWKNLFLFLLTFHNNLGE
jgi:hypothetical protein